MAGPLGVPSTGPVVATIEVEDVDCNPPRGCWWDYRQWLPPKLKTSMAGPLAPW
jgi:hypothetical protein